MAVQGSHTGNPESREIEEHNAEFDHTDSPERNLEVEEE
jgi:hypothetical protein